MSPVVTEGYLPFGEHRTYYRVVGDPAASLARGMAPLLLLHGGPGSTHNYFEVLDGLAQTGRALIGYDQLGCGGSYVENRPDLWHAQTWVDELENLREHLGLKCVHLLGQSWGGMLAITYLCDRRPSGVRSVVLSSTLSSSQLWGQEQHRLISQMPYAHQQAIARAEQTGDYSDPAYQAAEALYMELHCSSAPAPDAPECLRRPKQAGRESYLVAWGPNEFTPTGTLARWDYTERLRDVATPALVVNGSEDLCTDLVAQTMADALPNARRERFEGCRHSCFVEQTAHYSAMLDTWMRQHD